MRQPDYERGETIDDVADEAYDRAVQEKLDDIVAAQPQKCSFCPQIFAGPTCPGCNEQRPTLTAMKNITAQQRPVLDLAAEIRARLRAEAADDTDVANIARHCGAV